MNDEYGEASDATELAAAELVASLKQMDAAGVELPIVDETAVWLVKVKKLGIQKDESSK
jgi:hypothetical protein